MASLSDHIGEKIDQYCIDFKPMSWENGPENIYAAIHNGIGTTKATVEGTYNWANTISDRIIKPYLDKAEKDVDFKENDVRHSLHNLKEGIKLNYGRAKGILSGFKDLGEEIYDTDFSPYMQPYFDKAKESAKKDGTMIHYAKLAKGAMDGFNDWLADCITDKDTELTGNVSVYNLPAFEKGRYILYQPELNDIEKKLEDQSVQTKFANRVIRMTDDANERLFRALNYSESIDVYTPSQKDNDPKQKERLVKLLDHEKKHNDTLDVFNEGLSYIIGPSTPPGGATFQWIRRCDHKHASEGIDKIKKASIKGNDVLHSIKKAVREHDTKKDAYAAAAKIAKEYANSLPVGHKEKDDFEKIADLYTYKDDYFGFAGHRVDLFQANNHKYSEFIGSAEPAAKWTYNNVLKPVKHAYDLARPYVIDAKDSIKSFVTSFKKENSDNHDGFFKQFLEKSSDYKDETLQFGNDMYHSLDDFADKTLEITAPFLQTALDRAGEGVKHIYKQISPITGHIRSTTVDSLTEIHSNASEICAKIGKHTGEFNEKYIKPKLRKIDQAQDALFKQNGTSTKKESETKPAQPNIISDVVENVKEAADSVFKYKDDETE